MNMKNVLFNINLQEIMGKKDRSKSRDRSRDKSREKKKDRKRSHERHHRSRSKQHREQKKKSKFSERPHEKVEDTTMDKAGELKSKLHQSLYGSKDEVKNLSLMKKLNPANKNLAIGMTLVEGTTNFPMGLNTGVFSMMNDASKIKRKIVLPKDRLLIGPKGNNQKQLQQKTGCKILVRGKGSQNQTGDYEDEEDLHVLVLGDGEAQVAKACAEIERIIFSDDDTLNKIKQDQMVTYQQGIGETEGDFNLSLTTPYGPPSQNAYILQVPNECVGLVIGKEGETIKNIAKKSGAMKVQVATSSAPGAKTRNIFVQGDPQSVERVRKELNFIVETQRKMNSGAINGSHKIELQIPVRLIGLIIGKGGETIKGINAKTGAFVCLSKDEYSKRNRKIVTITGTEDLCLIAKYEVQKIIQKGLSNLQNSGGLTADEAEMIKPLTPIAIQLSNLNIPIPMHIQTIQEDPTTQYVLNSTLRDQIPTSQIYDTFLSTSNAVEETIIEERPIKKFVKKTFVP